MEPSGILPRVGKTAESSQAVVSEDQESTACVRVERVVKEDIESLIRRGSSVISWESLVDSKPRTRSIIPSDVRICSDNA